MLPAPVTSISLFAGFTGFTDPLGIWSVDHGMAYGAGVGGNYTTAPLLLTASASIRSTRWEATIGPWIVDSPDRIPVICSRWSAGNTGYYCWLNPASGNCEIFDTTSGMIASGSAPGALVSGHQYVLIFETYSTSDTSTTLIGSYYDKAYPGKIIQTTTASSSTAGMQRTTSGLKCGMLGLRSAPIAGIKFYDLGGYARQTALATPTAIALEAIDKGLNGPVTYQWHRAATSGFTAGGGNAITGATARTLTDTVTPGSTWFHKCKATDASAVVTTTNQVVTFAPVESLAILFIGDSITMRTPTDGWRTPADAAVERIGARLGKKVTVLNYGQSGATANEWTSPGTYQAPAIAAGLAAGAKYVFFSIGANDCYVGAPRATYKTNIASVCADFVSAGFIVVLNAPSYVEPGAESGMWNEAHVATLETYRSVQEELANGGTILLGDVLARDFFKFRVDQLEDGVHPNAIGVESLGALWEDGFIAATTGKIILLRAA